MLFRVLYHKQPPGAIQTPLNLFNAFFCHKCLVFSVNITSLTKGPDFSNDMFLVKIKT